MQIKRPVRIVDLLMLCLFSLELLERQIDGALVELVRRAPAPADQHLRSGPRSHPQP